MPLMGLSWALLPAYFRLMNAAMQAWKCVWVWMVGQGEEAIDLSSLRDAPGSSRLSLTSAEQLTAKSQQLLTYSKLYLALNFSYSAFCLSVSWSLRPWM